MIERLLPGTIALLLIGLGFAWVTLGAPAAAGETAVDESPVVDESACRTARTAGRTLSDFTLAMANGNAERAGSMFGPDTVLVYLAGPASIIPRLPRVRPTREDRGGPRTWRYRSFQARSAEQLSEFVKGIKRIPFRLTQISLSPSIAPNLPPGIPPSAFEDEQKMAHFTVTGRGTGRPAWRRALQVSGKGAINCDGTIALVALMFRGGNTGFSRNPGVCRGDANLAVVSGTRICTTSRAGYRFWKRREAR